MSKDNGYMPALILTVIVLVTTGLLALTSGLTQPARDAQAIAAQNANRQMICPDAATFEPIDLTVYQADHPGVSEAFAVRDPAGTLLGYLYQSEFRGYGGAVPSLVAITIDNKVMRVLPLDNDETPGLGKKIADAGFVGQFADLDATQEITVKPNETDKVLIDSIAGATISSNAVARSVNQATALHQLIMTEVQ